MTETIRLEKVDEVFFKIISDRGILREIQEHFTFEIEGAKFHPKVRNKVWDGKIRLVNLTEQTLYIGLLEELQRFCDARDYELEFNNVDFSDTEMSLAEAGEFMNVLVERAKNKIPDFELRDYQVEAFAHCVRKNRSLMLSPTSSGKSFIIHSICEYYSLPTLIVVDSVAAVHQMAQDLEEYGVHADDIHKIYGSQEKDVDTRIVISTWQSLMRTNTSTIQRFDVIIGDEAHHFAAKTFIELMEKTVSASYKFGFTGTIKGSKCNTMVLEGLFGRVRDLVKTRKLMDEGYVAEIDLKCIILHHTDKDRKELPKKDINKEIDFLIDCEARTRFIRNLAGSLKGNTLVFFQRIRHGELLAETIQKKFPNKKVILIHGGVDGEIRNDIRAVIEKEDDIVAVVSYGTFQTAISIKNIFNMIMAAPTKSKIRILQSIGRGLRMGGKNDKIKIELFDIADDLSTKSWKNFTLKHFAERIITYSEEKFRPKIYNVKLKD